jgi:hypothetical protein
MMNHVLGWILPAAIVLSVAMFGCDRQPPQPKALKEPPHAPETAVGEMTIRAIEKAKGVEPTLGQAAEHTADVLKDAAP